MTAHEAINYIERHMEPHETRPYCMRRESPKLGNLQKKLQGFIHVAGRTVKALPARCSRPSCRRPDINEKFTLAVYLPLQRADADKRRRDSMTGSRSLRSA